MQAERGCQIAGACVGCSPSDWAAFLLGSPCAQHALVVLMHVVFFSLVLIYRTLRKCCFRRVESLPYMNQLAGRSTLTSFRYSLALLLTSAGAAPYLIVTSWRLFLAWTGVIHDPHWEGVPIHEAAFVGAQCVAFFQMAVAVDRERQRGAFFHSPPTRAWWIANFLVSVFPAFLAVQRIAQHKFHPASTTASTWRCYPSLSAWPSSLTLVKREYP